MVAGEAVPEEALNKAIGMVPQGKWRSGCANHRSAPVSAKTSSLSKKEIASHAVTVVGLIVYAAAAIKTTICWKSLQALGALDAF
jgi:hypothetical protein